MPGLGASAAPIEIEQDWAGLGLSCVVWEAAEVLARFIADRPSMLPQPPLPVLELGAGPGLAGLVAARLGAQSVILTDRGGVVFGCTARSAAANGGGRVHARSLTWGNTSEWDTISAEFGRPGLCIGSDLVYDEDVLEPLMQVLRMGCDVTLLAGRYRYRARFARLQRGLRRWFEVCLRC